MNETQLKALREEILICAWMYVRLFMLSNKDDKKNYQAAMQDCRMQMETLGSVRRVLREQKS